jgi:hypothetical protein
VNQDVSYYHLGEQEAGCVSGVQAHQGVSYNRQDSNGLMLPKLGTFAAFLPYPLTEDVMKAYFANLPTRTWMLLLVPALALAYPIVSVVLPAVVRAVVPEVVRSVLSLI